jgi:predicted RNase H-like HicB family nuclease
MIGKEAAIMRVVCNTYIKQEREMYTAVCIEFGIASCGNTAEEAYKNVIEAVTIHLNDAQELDTLDELLAEAGFEVPQNLKGDITIQPGYVMFGTPFIAEVA